MLCRDYKYSGFLADYKCTLDKRVRAMKKVKGHVLLYDRIRILATLLVLIGHFTSLSMNEDNLF